MAHEGKQAHMNWITDINGGVILQVKAVPRARKSGIAGLLGDALKVRIQAPPVDGKANEALVGFLAGLLDVPGSRVSILAGESSRIKRVKVAGLGSSEVRKRIGL